MTVSYFDGKRGVGPLIVVYGGFHEDWREGHPTTSYSENTIARFIYKKVRMSLSMERKVLVAAFKTLIRYPGRIRGHQWTRVCKEAMVGAWGLPKDNIKRLYAFNKALEKHLHKLYYTCIVVEPMWGAAV